MSYSIAKEIGAMAAVLKGQVDAILLTGGVAYNEPVNDVIREHCSFLAPIFIYPGEDEMGALMLNALSVLRGEKNPRRFTHNSLLRFRYPAIPEQIRHGFALIENG